MNYEIERRFVIIDPKINFKNYPCNYIKQGYIILDENGTGFRIRQKDDKFFLTIKKGFGLKRLEKEIEISKEQFESLWELVDNYYLEKKRYKIPLNNLIIEFDEYLGKFNGLFTAEIEFTNEEDAKKFTPPTWFTKDVTNLPGYTNHDLVFKGIPLDWSKLKNDK